MERPYLPREENSPIIGGILTSTSEFNICEMWGSEIEELDSELETYGMEQACQNSYKAYVF